MRTKKCVISLLVLTVTFFAGCGTINKTPPPKPAAQIIDIKLQNVRPKSATLLFDLEVDNPYEASLPLTKLNYRLISGDNTFLLGSTSLDTTVSPNTKESISLPVKVNYNDMLEALEGVTPGSTISYKAELALSVSTPPFGLIELPLENEGKLLLPAVPKAKADLKKIRTPDVVFVPTPQEVVDKMLEMTHVTKNDLLYDLGCGDGRIVVTAAKKYGCVAVGYDIDPQRIKESQENVEKNNVGNLVTIEQKDIFTLDLSKANVITLYLLPSLNVKLIPQLDKLKPGSRIVSHDFAMEGVTPDQVVELTSSDDNVEHKIYLWTAPLKKEKAETPAPVTP